MNRITNRDINVMAVCKGTERYIFLWDDASEDAMAWVLVRFAFDPRLSFTSEDAVVAEQRMREDTRRRMERKDG